MTNFVWSSIKYHFMGKEFLFGICVFEKRNRIDTKNPYIFQCQLFKIQQSFQYQVIVRRIRNLDSRIPYFNLWRKFRSSLVLYLIITINYLNSISAYRNQRNFSFISSTILRVVKIRNNCVMNHHFFQFGSFMSSIQKNTQAFNFLGSAWYFNFFNVRSRYFAKKDGLLKSYFNSFNSFSLFKFGL